MTSGEIEKLRTQRPYRPFRLCLADGRKIRVSSPEFLSYRLNARLLFIEDADGSYEAVDLLLVVSVLGDALAA